MPFNNSETRPCYVHRQGHSDAGVGESMSYSDSQKNDDATLRANNSATVPLTDSTLELLPGSIFLSKYKVIERIGSGGMGVVYRCNQTLFNKDVAIKTLNNASKNDEAVIRFQIEAKAAGSLSHANLVSVHDFGTTENGVPYMVMDYVPGTTLQDFLQNNGQVPLQMVLDLFIECADGLAHAHNQKVLHRDIKPSNIMLLEENIKLGSIRILDFGIAKIGSDSTKTQELTKTGMVMGSPLYMSPEQSIGKKMDARTDIYSLGCVMYECLSGSPPFAGETIIETLMQHQLDAPKSLHEVSLGRQIPDELECLVMKMLEKDIGERTPSMESVRDQLIAIRKSPSYSNAAKLKLPQPDHEISPRTPFSKRAPSLKIMIGSLAIFAIGVCAYLVQILLLTPVAIDKPLSNVDAHLSNAELDRVGYDNKVHKLLNENSSRGYTDANIRATELTFNQFRMIQDSKWIRTLTIGESSNFTPVGLRLLANNPITVLNLDRSELNDSCMEAVSEFKNLRTLSLNFCSGITSKGVESLSHLKGLKFLHMKGVPVSLDALEAIMHDSDLYEIQLGNSALVNDSSLRILGQYKKPFCIGVTNTNITDQGLKFLGKKVLFLGLRANRKITDKGIETIVRQCPNLVKIDIANTSVTPKGVMLLQNLQLLDELMVGPMEGETAKDRENIIRVFRDEKHVKIIGI